MFKKKGHKDGSEEDIELVLLTSANNEFELQTIKSLLEDNNIPYIIKDHGVGGYMRILTGGSIYGAEILVEKSQLEEALRIVSEFPWGLEDGGEEWKR